MQISIDKWRGISQGGLGAPYTPDPAPQCKLQEEQEADGEVVFRGFLLATKGTEF